MCEKLQKVWNETTSIIFIEERREERSQNLLRHIGTLFFFIFSFH